MDKLSENTIELITLLMLKYGIDKLYMDMVIDAIKQDLQTTKQ